MNPKMPWFRPALANYDLGRTLTLDVVRALIATAVSPAHFFADPTLALHWEATPSETIRWEIYQGRLLDPAHTREMKQFEAWSVYQIVDDQRAAEPLLCVKLAAEEQTVHVVRGLLCHVWEAYDAGGNVIDSRETTKWTRELVGSIHLAEMQSPNEFLDELVCLLWQAVVGTSRLPLTSLETPLPTFALGQLGYVFRDAAAADPVMNNWSAFINHALHPALSFREQAKLLEVVLRAAAPEEIPKATAQLVNRWHAIGHSAESLAKLLRTVFNEVSLSPYTHFVDNALAFMHAICSSPPSPQPRAAEYRDEGPAERQLTVVDQIEFLSHLLRQQGRHLTAYDLFTFHHRGANYPDALLQDAALRQYLALIERHPDLFGGEHRLRRRALRQACWLRRFYEGHAVPDAPTSPGENQRVLPAPFARVPEEQLLNPVRRERRLFTDRSLQDLLGPQARQCLQASLGDLDHADEVLELGMAVFIDRPLGLGKKALEPDLTPLLAHEAFSPSIAERRLFDWVKFASDLGMNFPQERAKVLSDRLRNNLPVGIPAARAVAPMRPVPSLADAQRVAEDFIVLRTLPGGLRELLALTANPAEAAALLHRGSLIRVAENSGPARLVGFDCQARPILELVVNISKGYQRRAGVEWPRAGLTFKVCV